MKDDEGELMGAVVAVAAGVLRGGAVPHHVTLQQILPVRRELAFGAGKAVNFAHAVARERLFVVIHYKY